MTNIDTTLVKQYPEAPLIVAMAESAWAGSCKKKIEGTIYIASIEKGNNQLGVITLWKMKG